MWNSPSSIELSREHQSTLANATPTFPVSPIGKALILVSNSLNVETRCWKCGNLLQQIRACGEWSTYQLHPNRSSTLRNRSHGVGMLAVADDFNVCCLEHGNMRLICCNCACIHHGVPEACSQTQTVHLRCVCVLWTLWTAPFHQHLSVQRQLQGLSAQRRATLNSSLF